MAEQPLHIAVLESLAKKVTDRREELKEQMAGGLSQDDYRIAIGRSRECRSLLEHIDQMLLAVRKGDTEEDEESDDADIQRSSGIRRTSVRKPHRQSAR